MHCGFDRAVTAALPLDALAPAKGSTDMSGRLTGLVSPSLAGGNGNKNSCKCETLKDAAKADGGVCHLAKYQITGLFGFFLNNIQVA